MKLDKHSKSKLQNAIKSTSRRTFNKAVLTTSLAGFFTPSSVLLAGEKDSKKLLGFEAITPSTEDRVRVPKGYAYKVLVSFGDPLFSDASKYDERKNINAKALKNSLKVFGDNNDGIIFYPLDTKNGKERAIFVANNEYPNPEIMFSHFGKKMTKNDIKYMQNSVGVSVFEIERDGATYKLIRDSKFNRRIHANTKMLISGPASGDDALKNDYDMTGTIAYGTFGNCANGKTPWGTYLTCEENVNDYFDATKDTERDSNMKRFGVDKGAYSWGVHDPRFDYSKTKNEANKFGWIVEIDPFDPISTPIKRTALGRFKHENVEIIVNADNTITAYMGDDEANEFLYKFVSKDSFKPDGDNSKMLDNGTLYVAKLKSDDATNLSGSGKWIPLIYGKGKLTKKNGFISQADVLIRTREAATLVGATPLDRCEWIASDNDKKYCYVTMTNNTKRTDPGPASPRANNIYGQIMQWRAKNDNHKLDDFKWSIFALGGNPSLYKDERKGSISKESMFNSPDGLKIDKAGRLWIETDGNYSNAGDYAGQGNNQIICANPISGEMRRFLTTPVASEVTGLTFNTDSTVMFACIQHPGEYVQKNAFGSEEELKAAKLKGMIRSISHFPNGKNTTPRSSIVMIYKLDGKEIGS